jgi:hypothetical protein
MASLIVGLEVAQYQHGDPWAACAGHFKSVILLQFANEFVLKLK